MLRKNVASQFVHIAGINVSTGAVVTGATWTMRRCLDGTFAAGGATITEDGTTGFYKVALAQADTNANDIGYFFTATTCVPVTINVVTTAADPTDAVRFGLTALPNAAAEAAGGLYTRGTGAGQINQAANGMIDTNPVRLNNVSQSLLDLKDFADDGYDPSTNKVQGVVLTDTVTTYTGNTPQTGDSFARLGAPAGASVSADIAAIEAQTDDIGTAGAGLTAIPWNPAWDAEVQSEVDDALVAQRLDELLNADSDIDGAAPPVIGSVFHELMTKTAGSFTYDQTTDSLEALRDNTGTAGAGLTAIDLPDQTMNITGNLSGSVGSVTSGVTVTTNNDKAGYALSSAGVQAVWDALTSVLTTVGSIGKLLVDTLNATLSSRASQASVDDLPTNAELATALASADDATLAAIAALNNLSAAQVNAEVVDALATDTYAEPGQGAPAATTSLAAKLNYLFKWMRNKKDNDGAVTNFYADDGTTVDQKQTTSESGGTVTKGEITAGP